MRKLEVQVSKIFFKKIFFLNSFFNIEKLNEASTEKDGVSSKLKDNNEKMRLNAILYKIKQYSDSIAVYRQQLEYNQQILDNMVQNLPTLYMMKQMCKYYLFSYT